MGLNNAVSNFLGAEGGNHDIAKMKALFALKNMQNENPLLFKRINDESKDSQAAGLVTAPQFKELFMNSRLLMRDVESVDNPQRHAVPSLQEIAELFEFLDTNRTGMI